MRLSLERSRYLSIAPGLATARRLPRPVSQPAVFLIGSHDAIKRSVSGTLQFAAYPLETRNLSRKKVLGVLPCKLCALSDLVELTHLVAFS